jgi:hypothetical protein
MQATLTVLINALEGREDEFNDWLTYVHIRDVMRFGGSIRVQRLVASSVQLETPSHKYFTIYDTFDPALLSKEHHDAAGTRRMVTAPNYDRPNIMSGYYYPVAARTNDPVALRLDDAPAIFEQIDVPAEKREAFESWYAETRLPALLMRPAHISGVVMRFDPAGQLAAFTPVFSHVAIWRVSDLAVAIEAWRDVAETPLAGLKRRVGCFESMAPYLTRDEVETSSDEILAVEEGARIRAEAQAAAAGAAVSG